MNKLKFMTIAALLCGILFLANCSGGASTTSNTAKNDAPKADAPKNDAPKADAPKADAPAGDSVGVAECDEYIKKYEACLTKIAAKAPQMQPALKTAFETQRNGFKQAAANPTAKATLASTCKQAIETQKAATTTAYACEW